VGFDVLSKRWLDELSVTQLGDWITGVGKIEWIDGVSVTFDDCELLAPEPRASERGGIPDGESGSIDTAPAPLLRFRQLPPKGGFLVRSDMTLHSMAMPLPRESRGALPG
jgi:hypothetical protein